MPYFDLPLSELRTYRSNTPEPDALDAFWRRAISDARRRAVPPTYTPWQPGSYGLLAVDDVTFSGADGDPIRGWFLRRRDSTGKLACLVTFVGYGGGRGLPSEHALYAACGHAVFVMDTRGQGGSWEVGATADPGAGRSGAEHPGVMTRGVGDPETYYYRRLYVDAVRAVETASAHGRGADRVAVGGHSQGGGLALAAAALAPDRVRLCHADMPFLCDIERAITVAPDPPYTELVRYLAQHVTREAAIRATLRYIDCALLAARIRARCLVSVGLMDAICPPSTVFAAYNAITAEKDIAVYPFCGHAVPSEHHERRLADFAREMT